MSVPRHPLSSPRAERTRATIVRAATRLFGAAGYAQVSMDKVATEAAVTKPTVYAHFGSKTALFETLISDVIVRSHGAELAPARSVEEVGEAMFEWSRNRLDWLLADETVGLMRAASAEGIRRPEWAQNLLGEFDFGAMERWLADLDDADILDVRSPAEAASLFTALTKGALFYPVLVAGEPITPKPDRDVLIREAVRVFLAAYSPTSSHNPP
ncbi:TetR/AcrR family transcriptional regulator [Rhodococcus sp. NPDC049939]|uniref:TetR/AcrR family transcriptional regulator n=1 Tax=Rhodococcus sp. NPDC049939 TaxID=3155511 RepID=UPI0033E04047